MHVADGILPASGCAAAFAGSAVWLGLSCRRVEVPEASRMGLAAAATFVVSTIQFPLMGMPAHLAMLGLLGILLGRRAFPALFASLLFQALLLQHGGLVSLGVNALNMGSGTLVGAGIWRLRVVPPAVRAALAGFCGSLLPVLLLAWEFEAANYGRGFYAVAAALASVAVVEALVTVLAVRFFGRARPDLLAVA